MSIHEMRFPGESEAYRNRRDELLAAEMALRAQMEEVAALRRALPPGGVAQNYQFEGAAGPVSLRDLFGEHATLIVYSFMFAADAAAPCPMCSAFMDSVSGQLQHINARTGFVVAARSPYERIQKLAHGRGWSEIPWISTADNSYPVDYHSEAPDGAQFPMCNVFTKADGVIRHYWCSEMFFAPSPFHPRHIDMLWPLWNFFDVTPDGRGDFMPQLTY